MNYLNKSKEELEGELLKLKKSFDSLTILYLQQEKIQKETEFLLRERMKESESKYQHLIENINDVIFEIDEKAIIRYISPSVESIIGFKPEEIMGHSFLTFVGENADFLSKRFELLIEKGEIKNDYKIFSKSGESVWLRFSTKAKVINGKFLGGTGTLIDITERKLAEEKIKKNEENFRYLVETINDAIYEISMDGIINYVSPAIERIIGYTAEELTGKNFFDFIYAEDRPMLLNALANLGSMDYSFLEYRYVTKSGKLRWVQSSTSPNFKDGILVGGTGSLTDINQRKLAEQRLRILSRAVEQSPVTIMITNLDANIEYVNPAFELTTGYSFQEVVGKSSKILQSGQTDNGVYKDLWEAITSGKEWHGEWVNKKKNGEIFWESVLMTPIHDEKRVITNYLAVKQDITNRKNAENEIRDLNANLELKIAYRTNQLAESNLPLVKEIEERIRFEIALKESEQNYRTVVENISEVIFYTDAAGIWLFLNHSWTEITGFSIEESLGTMFLDYVYPEDRARNMKLFLPLLRKEKDYCRHEIRYITKDGGYRWVEVFARLKLDETGEAVGTYGTLRDITDGKLAKDFENELLQLSPKLTGISTGEIDTALNLALERIGHFLAADRAYIFVFDDEQNTMKNTYEWCNVGISPEIENLQKTPCEGFPMFVEKLRQHENILIPSVKDLPDNWKSEREILEPQGIQSLIVIPMFSENILIGFVGLDSVHNHKEYTVAETNILKVWSSMLASLINNQRTEFLLEQTRQNYETFFNTIDDFLWVLDEKGNIIHVNNTVRNRLGYTIEELMDQSVLMVHPPDRREEAGRIVGEMLAGQADFCLVPVVTKAGIPIPVETRVKAGFWNNQRVIFGVSKDISKIELSEQKFSSAFQANAAMMSISRFEDGKFLDINNAFIESTGYSREEILGKTCFELGLFVDPEIRSEIVTELESNIPVVKKEVRTRIKDGTNRVGLLSAHSIYIGDQRCLLMVNLDITERIKSEEDLKKARFEAEQANLAKSEFLSRMSHELRTPMNSILGFAQLLEMGELNSGQRKGVNHIVKSGKHLLDLINEVLDISRIEAGHLSLSIEPVQVKDVIHEVIDFVRHQANNRQIILILAGSDGTSHYVKSDRQRLKQILLNLVNNAVKYNKPGGSVTLESNLMPPDSNNQTPVRISVRDNGIGIAEKDFSKLFDPFERIGAEKTGTEGTGLGLSVVKKLVDALGGQMGVESIEGEGSVFWVEFPQSDLLQQVSDKQEISDDQDHRLASKSGVILYIEDNESNVELVQEILESQRSNIRLISESKGIIAVPLAIEYSPDLILLDLNLPDIHGIDVLQQLLSNSMTKAIPVVVISADAMPTQIEQLLAAGARKYVTKPLDLNILLNIIDEYIS